MILNYLSQYFKGIYNNADKVKSINDVKRDGKELIRVLNFNTLYGIHKGNNPVQSLKVFRSVLKKIHIEGDNNWVSTHCNHSRNIIEICKKVDADIIILNEVLYNNPSKGFIEDGLRTLGYKSVFRGEALHSRAQENKPAIPSGIILAYKGDALLIEDGLGYSEHRGGASGGYCMEIRIFNLIVIGLHLGLGDPNRQKLQKLNLERIVKTKLAEGKNILIVGDFNQDPWNINKNLGKFNLKLFTAPSFPAYSWLPPIRALDQVWINNNFGILKNHFMIPTFSDHFAQIVDIQQ